MNIWLLIIIGIGGGLLGGMGMGGGTLLIPLLTMFTGVSQHLAQSINLIAFIPMSIVALIIHSKNKLVKYKYLLSVSLPAVGASIVSSFLTKKVGGASLTKYFGIFLILIGIYQLTGIIIEIVKTQRRLKKIQIEFKQNIKDISFEFAKDIDWKEL